MCGFVGCVVRRKKKDSVLDSVLKMIHHRGPDHSDFKIHNIGSSYVYLGHTRLSIIDLSENASQPFDSHCGRFSLIFNGEIYNYRELRNELRSLGYTFTTESDTEVLLYSFVEWGTGCLNYLIGMFSFVFFDKYERKLTLVRDAFGIKPFYYAICKQEIFFASELLL